MGRSDLVEEGALVLCGARQVHTFGLDRPIDVVFCDRHWTVLHVVREMAPRRIGRPVWKAHFAIEAAAGAMHSIEPGDVLSLAIP